MRGGQVIFQQPDDFLFIILVARLLTDGRVYLPISCLEDRPSVNLGNMKEKVKVRLVMFPRVKVNRPGQETYNLSG